MNAFQDYYPDDLSHCYGCGRQNEHGYRIKTFWDGEENVTRFSPEPFHCAIPGFVYGGLLAESPTACRPGCCLPCATSRTSPVGYSPR